MIEEIKSTTTQSEAVDQQQACSVLPVASCAHRLFLSPHEWTWTQAEQEEMAREIIRLGNAIKLAAPLLREIHAHPARNGPIQVAAGKLMAALGITQNAGYATCHAHPECYAITEKWDDMDWECHSEEGPRETPRMYWPNKKPSNGG